MRYCTLHLTKTFGSKRPASHFELLLRELLWNDFTVYLERSMSLYQIMYVLGCERLCRHRDNEWKACLIQIKSPELLHTYSAMYITLAASQCTH